MIHSGLNLDLKGSSAQAQHCCLRKSFTKIDITKNFWFNEQFQPLRQLNLENKWDPQCNNCRQLEELNLPSFRTGTNDGLGIYGKTDLTGPVRLDLMFDISCNLACRTCGPHSSTYWQKHLKENNRWDKPVFAPRKKDEVISALSNIDLSNLRMLVFCGGETLLGQEYWDVAEWISNQVPDAKKNLTLCFQTNGTQEIHPKNYKIIDKFFLVKLHVSLDGTEDQFEYLRWPASWAQVVDNLNTIKDTAPSNLMFLIEETISIFNLPYINRLDGWVKQNFTTNRERDIVNHTRHFAHGIFSLSSMSSEYADAMLNTKYKNFVPENFKENNNLISTMLSEIKKYDQYRNQDFTKTFPLLADYYAKWL